MTKILICDTDANMLTAISRYLSWYGFDVEALADPDELLTELEKKAFDLLVCEARLDPQDGFALCQKVRHSHPPAVQSLSILITAPEDPNFEEARLMQQENFYFILKYKSPEKWYEKVSAIIFNKKLVPI